MIAFFKTSHKTHTHCNKMIVPTPPAPRQVEKYEEDEKDERKKGGGLPATPFPQ